MTRPGVDVITRDTLTARSAPTDTGVAFIAGLATEGPIDEAVRITSLAKLVDSFGDRDAGSFLYDTVETFFREGGSVAYIARVAGPAGTEEDDDRENIVDANWVTALNLFTKDLGPGQVLTPGRTTDAAYEALATHAEANNRIALLDGADTATVATLTAAAAAVTDTRRAALFAPWYTIPGYQGGSPRTVPPSAVLAGVIARNDAETGNPNQAVAGVYALCRYCSGVTQKWSDSDREDLNDAGVNVGRVVNGQVQNYGYRTLANPSTDEHWVQLSKARLHMAIIAEGYAIAERYVFAQIDGEGHKAAEFQGELTGMLLTHYARRALYGKTPEEAFVVDVGSDVNTDESIAAGELRAVLAVRTSPFAEHVILEIVSVPVTEEI